MKFRSVELIVENNEYIDNPSYLIKNQIIIPYQCQSKTICFPYLISFEEGSYSIELYGGSGGNASRSLGGKGGYTKANVHFFKRESFYLFIGSSGQNAKENNHEGGYNGGGSGTNIRGSGGGATDLRLTKNDLNTRILVAAGGGGAMDNENSVFSNGGDGGGLIGNIGDLYKDEIPCIPTQDGCVNGTDNLSVGTFGYGANVPSDESPIGGGGGGWWGGGSANGCGSAGGSSHILLSLDGITLSGKNVGYGYAIITKLISKQTCVSYPNNNNFILLTSIFIFIK